jgi:hypothetical protein
MCGVTSWLSLGAGILLVLLSLAGAFLEVWKKILAEIARGGADAAAARFAEGAARALIAAITALLEAFSKASVWLAMLFAGVILCGSANYMSLSFCAPSG